MDSSRVKRKVRNYHACEQISKSISAPPVHPDQAPSPYVPPWKPARALQKTERPPMTQPHCLRPVWWSWSSWRWKGPAMQLVLTHIENIRGRFSGLWWWLDVRLEATSLLPENSSEVQQVILCHFQNYPNPAISFLKSTDLSTSGFRWDMQYFPKDTSAFRQRFFIGRRWALACLKGT